MMKIDLKLQIRSFYNRMQNKYVNTNTAKLCHFDLCNCENMKLMKSELDMMLG